jgi:hypothetical protein
MTELEQNESTGEYQLKIIFSKGIKGDFYDAVENNLEEEYKEDDQLQRNKERSIGFIIEKVAQWRKLYNGFYNERQELKRMSLEDAAAKVGVSKKSLDDYLS